MKPSITSCRMLLIAFAVFGLSKNVLSHVNSKMQSAKCKVQSAKCKVQSIRDEEAVYELRSTKQAKAEEDQHNARMLEHVANDASANKHNDANQRSDALRYEP
jgi:hypothetical protein